MTQAEELRLHNLFIKFKNDGKSLDEIKMLLEVEEELLSKWDRGFEEESRKLALNNHFGSIKISGINAKGTYESQVDVTFQLDKLAFIKLQLITIINSIKDENHLNYFQEGAKKYFPIFEQYVSYIQINHISETEYSADVKCKTDDSTAKKLVQEAIDFYVEYEKGQQEYRKNVEKAVLLENKTQDTYQNAKNILPYCLKSLRCKAFDGINETGFEGLPLDTNWIFLIGENGYGKTTLLRAIALGLLGENEEDVITLSLIADEEPEIGVEYFSESQSFINNIGKPLQSLEHLACYGPSRLQIQTDQTKNDVAKKSTVTYSLFNSDGILLNIEFEMLIWFLEKNPRFEAVKQTILRLIPYLADIEVNVAKRMIYYIEKEPIEEGVRYNPVTFDQLASGFRSILAMVGDMMIRLFKSQPDIAEPHELAGIVLIDELDLHWHPKMQREIPSLLTTIFPKVQFIASTHSLVPLLGAPENSVLLKVHRTAEEGVTVE